MPPQAHRKLQADDATFLKRSLLCKKEFNDKAILRLFVDNYSSGEWGKIGADGREAVMVALLRGTLSEEQSQQDQVPRQARVYLQRSSQ